MCVVVTDYIFTGVVFTDDRLKHMPLQLLSKISYKRYIFF